MQRIELKKGDDAWIFMSNHSGELSKGKVLEVLDLSEHGFVGEHYLIEIPTGIEPVLEVRDGLAVSDSADKPIGFLRKGTKKPIWDLEDPSQPWCSTDNGDPLDHDPGVENSITALESSKKLSKKVDPIADAGFNEFFEQLKRDEKAKPKPWWTPAGLVRLLGRN